MPMSIIAAPTSATTSHKGRSPHDAVHLQASATATGQIIECRYDPVRMYNLCVTLTWPVFHGN